MNALNYRPKSKLLSEVLPYLMMNTKKEIIWLKDGSATKTFALIPKNYSSATTEELELLRSGLTSVIAQVPEGIMLQFLLIREKTDQSTDEAYSNWGRAHFKEDQLNELPRLKLFEARQNALNDQWGQGNIFQTKIYVTIRVSPPYQVRAGVKSGPFSHVAFFKQKNKYEKSTEDIESELIQAVNNLKLGFEALSFETKEVSALEQLKVVFKFLNPNREVPMKTDDADSVHIDLAEKCALTDFVETDDGLLLGKTHVRVATLKNLPESSIPCIASMLSTIPDSFALVVTMLVLSQADERERLTRRQRLTQGLAAGNNVRNLYAETQLQDIEDTISAMISSGDKLLAASFHLITFENESR